MALCLTIRSPGWRDSHLRPTCGSERIRCRAVRETIAELAGFAHASSLEIGEREAEAAGLLGRASCTRSRSVALITDRSRR